MSKLETQRQGKESEKEMSAGFCLQCGLKLDGTAEVEIFTGPGKFSSDNKTIHAHCKEEFYSGLAAWDAEQARIASMPSASAMQQQLDRIESEVHHVRKSAWDSTWNLGYAQGISYAAFQAAKVNLHLETDPMMLRGANMMREIIVAMLEEAATCNRIRAEVKV